MVIDRSVSPSTRSARSRLSDALDHIRTGKIEEVYLYDGSNDDSNNEFTSSPPKRRSTSSRYATGDSRRSKNDHDHSKSTSKTSDDAYTGRPPRTSGFILKLFDRTVDLAQFSQVDANEDKPLYPVCRAWVHSQNLLHNRKLAAVSTQKQISAKDGNEEDAEEENDDEPTSMSADDLFDAVYKLPKPIGKDEITKNDKATDIDLRIPSSVRNFKPADNVVELIDNALMGRRQSEWTAQALLEYNKLSWKRCRDDWKQAGQLNESRYAKSAKILKDIYSKNSSRHLL